MTPSAVLLYPKSEQINTNKNIDMDTTQQTRQKTTATWELFIHKTRDTCEQSREWPNHKTELRATWPSQPIRASTTHDRNNNYENDKIKDIKTWTSTKTLIQPWQLCRFMMCLFFRTEWNILTCWFWCLGFFIYVFLTCGFEMVSSCGKS